MCSVKQRYRDISPVTLQVVGGDMSSSLYCATVEGLAAAAADLVESFLVELYRCKLCQFTCGLKSTISTHLQQRHRPPTLTYLSEGGGDAQEEEEEEVELQQTEDDEDFLLYNMLDNMSPHTCDISSEAGLQVAHTCEVSTLFEEEEECSIFPLKGGSVDLSPPPSTQEVMAQSAHLRTLGLCRISINKSPPITSAPMPRPPPPDRSPHPLTPDGETVRRPSLSCVLCPLMLSSRRMLDIHVRSHRAGGGFGCLRCDWTADSWDEFQPHWRSHGSGRSHSRRKCHSRGRSHSKRKEQKKEASQKHNTETQASPLIGQVARKEAELLTSTTESGKKQTRKQEKQHVKRREEASGFCCSVCHRTFSSKLTLRRHQSVHGGDKPHACPHCSYSSRLKGSLLQHLRTHTGEKPHKCTQCAYASIDRSSLLRHCRTHSQEKPHTCPHCEYSSIQKKSLDLHRRRHHTGEVFPCQQCQYSSPDRQLLLRHVRRHHAHSQHASGQEKAPT